MVIMAILSLGLNKTGRTIMEQSEWGLLVISGIQLPGMIDNSVPELVR
jgi:hypothetical protein